MKYETSPRASTDFDAPQVLIFKKNFLNIQVFLEIPPVLERKVKMIVFEGR